MWNWFSDDGISLKCQSRQKVAYCRFRNSITELVKGVIAALTCPSQLLIAQSLEESFGLNWWLAPGIVKMNQVVPTSSTTVVYMAYLLVLKVDQGHGSPLCDSFNSDWTEASHFLPQLSLIVMWVSWKRTVLIISTCVKWLRWSNACSCQSVEIGGSWGTIQGSLPNHQPNLSQDVVYWDNSGACLKIGQEGWVSFALSQSVKASCSSEDWRF